LADPYLLGSASGASLGVALGLALLGPSVATGLWLHVGLTGMAFAGAVLAVVLTLALARGVQHSLRLLLAGVIVGVLLGAVSSLITLLRPDVLQGMQGFVLGSTAFVSWPACGLMLAVLLLCSALAAWLSPLLDALSLGEFTTLSLGLPLAPMRVVLVGVLSLATATAVAQLGLIAFVGLAAPHVVRSLTHSTYRWGGLLSAGMGGALLLWADVLARAVLAPQELPVGLLTAVLGGVYLLWLMQRHQRQEQGLGGMS
jgi:iron complex transport system permease protein